MDPAPVAGELGIEHLQDGRVLTDREATYDFGTVFRGQRNNELSIVIRNLGTGPMVLSSIEQVEGDAVEFSAPPADSAAATATYYVEFTPETVIEPAETLVIPVTFIPPQDPANSARSEHLSRLLVRTGGTIEAESTGTITLVGAGVSGQCEIRPVGYPSDQPFDGILNFGNVARGDRLKMKLEILNPAAIDARAHVDEIRSGSNDSFAFEYAAGSPRGHVVIPATTSGSEISKRIIEIEFHPTEARNYLAFADLQPAEECPVIPMQLRGVGVEQVLTWTPPSVDCGAVTPRVEVTQQVTFTNLGNKEAKLEGIQFTSSPNEFRVIAEGAQDPGSLTVPALGGTATLTIGCKPLSLGNKFGTLQFGTNLPQQPRGSINVKVFGGGPDIEVSPKPTLNFGKVAFFPNAPTQTTQQRIVLVENRGTKPPGTTVEYNLRLGKAENGFTAGFVELVAANANTQPDEFEWELPGYDPAVGLEARAGVNAATLKVRFTPKTLGAKAATLTIFSNDPDEAAVTVQLTAEVIKLNPCNYSVTPDPRADFGLVSPGDWRDLSVSVTNLSQGSSPDDVCLISGIRVAESGNGMFKLPLGEVLDSREILPGESFNILVRVQPTGSVSPTVTEVLGELEFYMSVEQNPRRAVELKVAVSQACLNIAPDDWNFGTVAVGCRSSSRDFRIFNSCTDSVRVKSVTMQNAAGQPAGGPDCQNSMGCPEFLITQQAVIPAGGKVLSSADAPLTFIARYSPIDFNADTGAIAIEAEQYGQPVTYLVTLRGKGDAVGYNEESFSSDGKPKSDILVVVDNSGSMGFAQEALAENFAAFVEYATQQNVDYHLGVVSSDMRASSTGPRRGAELVRTNNDSISTCPRSATRAALWVEPWMWDAAEEFVCALPGDLGDGTEKMVEAAYKALTPPLTAPGGHNYGFLREEAKLAIVFVTDAKDQSTGTGTTYLNHFLNIKGFNRSSELSIHAIAGFENPAPSGCGYDEGPDDGKFRYLVDQTSGVKGEICAAKDPNRKDEWKRVLEEIGKFAFGFRTVFQLGAYPDQANGPIKVFVDGEEVSKVQSGSKVWWYDPANNSVTFDPNFAPQAGNQVTVTYSVSCDPA